MSKDPRQATSQTPPRSSRGEGLGRGGTSPSGRSAAGGPRLSQAASFASFLVQTRKDDRSLLAMTACMIVPPQDLKHGSNHQFSGPGAERAVGHFGVETA
jgi:hypothetical protein